MWTEVFSLSTPAASIMAGIEIETHSYVSFAHFLLDLSPPTTASSSSIVWQVSQRKVPNVVVVDFRVVRHVYILGRVLVSSFFPSSLAAIISLTEHDVRLFFHYLSSQNQRFNVSRRLEDCSRLLFFFDRLEYFTRKHVFV